MITSVIVLFLVLTFGAFEQPTLSLDHVNLLKRPLSFYITSNAVHSIVTNATVQIGKLDLYYLESYPPFGKKILGHLLYLHGAAFSSHDWNRGNPSILQLSAAAGYRTIAIDLPGFKNSRSVGPAPSKRSEFMLQLMKALNISKPIIVSPSASGSYALTYVLHNQDKIRAFVPVAPCCVGSDGWENFKVPTMIVYGSEDKSSISKELLRIPVKNLVIIPNAPHAAYIKKPLEFMAAFVNFMNFINSKMDFT